MQLLSITDPRDNLEKAHRLELVRYAHANGMKDITEHMPAMLIRKRLRAAGLVNIRISDRPLGQYQPVASIGGEAISDPPVTEVSAEDDLERQFAQNLAPDYGAMGINDLRAECRKSGIKMARGETIQSLREKLSGQNAA